MKKNGFIMIGILIVIAVIGLLIVGNLKDKEAETVLVISVDGEVYRKIPLTEDTNESFRVETGDGHWNDVVITSGIVDVTASDCPHQICVETLPASAVGDMIVCLPHKLVVEIVPAE